MTSTTNGSLRFSRERRDGGKRGALLGSTSSEQPNISRVRTGEHGWCSLLGRKISTGINLTKPDCCQIIRLRSSQRRPGGKSVLARRISHRRSKLYARTYGRNFSRAVYCANIYITNSPRAQFVLRRCVFVVWPR